MASNKSQQAQYAYADQGDCRRLRDRGRGVHDDRTRQDLAMRTARILLEAIEGADRDGRAKGGQTAERHLKEVIETRCFHHKNGRERGKADGGPRRVIGIRVAIPLTS